VLPLIKNKNREMKKTSLLLGAIFMILMSCSSDDDNGNSDVSIIGIWNGTSSTYNGNNAGIPDNNIVKFTSDNRTEFVYEGFGNNGEDISEFGSWTKNGNNLTITWDEADGGLGTYSLEILELNDTTLKWKTNVDGGTLQESFTK
jgi:hypothetical protein